MLVEQRLAGGRARYSSGRGRSGLVPKAFLVERVKTSNIQLVFAALGSPVVRDHCPYLAIRLAEGNSTLSVDYNYKLLHLAVEWLNAAKTPSSSSSSGAQLPPPVLMLSIRNTWKNPIAGLVNTLSAVLINI